MVDASDANAVKKSKQRAKDADRNRRIVLERLCGDALGRKFLWDLISSAHVFSQTVDVSPAGHAVMCYKEGERKMGLDLFNEIVAKFPQAYIAMTRENAKATLEEEEDDGRASDSADPSAG